MADTNFFDAMNGTASVMSDYMPLRVDESACNPTLVEDLQGILTGQWLAERIRDCFEVAAYGGRIYGPVGTFDGVLSDATLPNYWRETSETVVRTPLWQPDGRHPVGKWFAETAARLIPVPPPEILDAVLRKHGINGSREPAPSMFQIEGGFALFVHRPKAKSLNITGISRDESLRALWEPKSISARTSERVKRRGDPLPGVNEPL